MEKRLVDNNRDTVVQATNNTTETASNHEHARIYIHISQIIMIEGPTQRKLRP